MLLAWFFLSASLNQEVAAQERCSYLKTLIFMKVPHDLFKFTSADEKTGGRRHKGRDGARPSTKNRIFMKGFMSRTRTCTTTRTIFRRDDNIGSYINEYVQI